MIKISGELYVVKILVMTWSEIASVRGVRECVFVVEVGWKRTLLWNVECHGCVQESGSICTRDSPGLGGTFCDIGGYNFYFLWIDIKTYKNMSE